MSEVCDFCKRYDPQWVYPTRSFIHTESTPAGDVTLISEDEWWACAPCHSMIERDDIYGLALRAAVLMVKDDSIPLIHGVMRRLFEDFDRHRTGEPTHNVKGGS